jgi:hypothetical protein
MLSRFLLLFSSRDLRQRYNMEKRDFYKKALPIITALIFALALILEIVYRVSHFGTLSWITSVVNWACFGIFLGMTLVMWLTKFVYVSWAVCPLLTLLTYFYFCFVDYQKTSGVIYFT